MTRIILLMVGLFAFYISQSQTKCDIDKLPKKDKILLQDFYRKLKEAIKAKNPQRLSGLCNFPFTCSYCIIDSTKENDKPYIIVTKKLFEISQYKLFFAKNLVETINNNSEIIPLLQVEDNNKIGCAYFFGYPIIKPSKSWEGLQGFFTIKKILGQYKIISTWTVP